MVPLEVTVHPLGIAIPSHVQPFHGHTFRVGARGQQAVHQPLIGTR